MTVDISHIRKFLPCPTPKAWIDEARKPENLPILLIDHCNNELKAASSALSIINRYRNGVPQRANNEHKGMMTDQQHPLEIDDQLSLLNKMSRLAREELRHYEQVLAILARRNISYSYLAAGRYAGQLRGAIRTFEPAKLVDTLIMGAFIEARSCERFAALSPWLDDELKKFYQSLLKSESRHFEDYLTLAEAINGSQVQQRMAMFAELEREAIESADDEFRFHSGVPVR